MSRKKCHFRIFYDATEKKLDAPRDSREHVILRSNKLFAPRVVTQLSIRCFGTLNDKLIGARLDRFRRPLNGATGGDDDGKIVMVLAKDFAPQA